MQKNRRRGMDSGASGRLKGPLDLEEVVEHWPAVERKTLQEIENISTNMN